MSRQQPQHRQPEQQQQHPHLDAQPTIMLRQSFNRSAERKLPNQIVRRRNNNIVTHARITGQMDDGGFQQPLGG
jgi:hypothetical protein